MTCTCHHTWQRKDQTMLGTFCRKNGRNRRRITLATSMEMKKIKFSHQIFFKWQKTWFEILGVRPIAPSYLQDCIIPYSPCRPLRTKHLLVVPPTKLQTYGDRSFNKAASLLWNKLPYHIWSCNKLDQFKRHLKSHLFSRPSHTCRDAIIFSP